MKFQDYSFGRIQIDGTTYEHDVIVDHGHIRNRKKGPSKAFRDAYGHTPLSTAEDIPWQCRRLIIGTGANAALPVMPQVEREAHDRGVELVILPTAEAIALLNEADAGTNAILHLTC